MFTLIELLVVVAIIAIIAILGAMLFGAVGGCNNYSQKTTGVYQVVKTYTTNIHRSHPNVLICDHNPVEWCKQWCVMTMECWGSTTLPLFMHNLKQANGILSKLLANVMKHGHTSLMSSVFPKCQIQRNEPMSFPIYILDDDTVLFTKQDKTHPEFWEETVAPQIAKKFKIPLSELVNLPYCQRRGRVVGENFYCGEELDKALVLKIGRVISQKIRLIFDDHECTLDHDRSMFNSLFRNPNRR
jgi:prepilin-type N-terminal cleavage/methylation domain-containing protein